MIWCDAFVMVYRVISSNKFAYTTYNYIQIDYKLWKSITLAQSLCYWQKEFPVSDLGKKSNNHIRFLFNSSVVKSDFFYSCVVKSDKIINRFFFWNSIFKLFVPEELGTSRFFVNIGNFTVGTCWGTPTVQRILTIDMTND